MPSSAVTETSIANRALQKLGARRVESLSQDHPNARSMAAAFAPVRDSLLRRRNWNFALKRASLPADSEETVWGGLNRFLLPDDFIRLVPDVEAGTFRVNYHKAWQIEGRHIVTHDSGPLKIRYLAQVTDVTMYDPSFAELLALALAYETCEEITASNTKLDRLSVDFDLQLQECGRQNAFEAQVPEPPEDDWLLARL